MKKIKWCFSAKGGLKIVEPNKELALSYLNHAEKTLSKVRSLIDEEDFVWASVRIYYCAYYSLYAFLQCIGVKSENHDCSIELVKELLGEDKVGEMDKFRKDRISSQYYLNAGQKDNLLSSYSSVKEFYLSFKNLVERIEEADIKEYRNKLEVLNE